ncbi:thiol-disulfide oxidoreductase DCC family protein [Candidatus Viridilinea mediisalina]|uniref:Thiol-disulfide oxidoreductase n=1 Tax=Candidatus Viridilinea mediisalina TaxID=2024553 RepID=A0A2A6RK69_9CHLR|nr:DUF393 domain-containing protein [Candidatus Viridilinea mediisalina]PDW03305.1 thiol-disulfide oxidoreductase [Candidatus Viridilinea mediisalina]
MNERYALLYDGACRICASQIETVAAHNHAGLIEILDMNDPQAQVRFPQVTPEMAQRELHLVAPDGQFYQGADAVRETLLRLPDLRGLGLLMGLPGVMLFARPIYGLIAANRYLLGGRVEACDDGSCKSR